MQTVSLTPAASVWITTFNAWHEQDIPFKKGLFGTSKDRVVPFWDYVGLLILNLGSGLKYHWLQTKDNPRSQELLRQFDEVARLAPDGSYPLYRVINFLVTVHPDTNQWGPGVRQAVIAHYKEAKKL